MTEGPHDGWQQLLQSSIIASYIIGGEGTLYNDHYSTLCYNHIVVQLLLQVIHPQLGASV